MNKLSLELEKELPYAVQEALDRLRVNFGFCGKEFKKVMITSSVPDEGKSFTSVHLWRMLAEAGNKVVLIDGDIRRSMLRRTYHITTEEPDFLGLAHYLAGQAEAEDVLYATNIENGYLIPNAYTIFNPALLLQNDRLEKLINRLAEKFDYVFIDTPPLSNVSDGELIASICDGALVVVRSGVTPRSLIATTFKQLERANCRVMGTVLNCVQREQNKYYYKKYSKYGYGYGYGYGSDSDSGK